MLQPNQAVADPRDHISLHRVAYILPHYDPPSGEFIPTGNWFSEYAYYSLGYWHFRKQGSLRIERKLRDDGGAGLSFDCMRVGRTGYNHYTQAKVLVGNDSLSVPIAWTVQTKLAASRDDAPYLHSGLSKSARYQDGALTIACNDDSETKRIPGAYTCKWCLIDVIQRLPRTSTTEWKFSLVDEFDEVRHHQSIAYRTSVFVPLKSGPRKLTAFEHLGEGVIPTVYWVDEIGRVIFVVSGVEVFVLIQANGITADYDDGPIHGQSIKKLLAEEA